MRINYFYIKTVGAGLAPALSLFTKTTRAGARPAPTFNHDIRYTIYDIRSPSGQAVIEFVFFALLLMMFISFISFTHLILQGSSEINLVARSRILARMIGPGFATIREPDSGRQERVDNTTGYRDEELEEGLDHENIINDSDDDEERHMAVIKLEDPEQTLEQRVYAKTYVGFGSMEAPQESRTVTVDLDKLLKEPSDIKKVMQSEFQAAAEGYTRD